MNFDFLTNDEPPWAVRASFFADLTKTAEEEPEEDEGRPSPFARKKRPSPFAKKEAPEEKAEDDSEEEPEEETPGKNPFAKKEAPEEKPGSGKKTLSEWASRDPKLKALLQTMVGGKKGPKDEEPEEKDKEATVVGRLARGRAVPPPPRVRPSAVGENAAEGARKFNPRFGDKVDPTMPANRKPAGDGSVLGALGRPAHKSDVAKKELAAPSLSSRDQDVRLLDLLSKGNAA